MSTAFIKRKMPDMTGVPGRLIKCPAGIEFGPKGRQSPYDSLLKQLAAANDGQILQFDGGRAKPSVAVRASKLGMKVEFAQAGNLLYVRFAGWKPDSLQWKAAARAAILNSIETQPRNEIQIANSVRSQKWMSEMDAGTVGAILKQMEQDGLVISGRDGAWAAKDRN